MIIQIKKNVYSYTIHFLFSTNFSTVFANRKMSFDRVATSFETAEISFETAEISFETAEISFDSRSLVALISFDSR